MNRSIEYQFLLGDIHLGSELALREARRSKRLFEEAYGDGNVRMIEVPRRKRNNRKGAR